MTQFYGRERELQRFNDLMDKRSASLVVMKGRRRIGKSRLAQEFSQSHQAYTFMGLNPGEAITAQTERENFAKQLELNTGLKGMKADDWMDLFWNLSNFTKQGRVVIVLDEINWMGSNDPTFLGKLKTAWDLYFSQNSELIMILTGSMSGWIEKNILCSTGFLGRISLDITLEELPLNQCRHFWSDYKIAPYEMFKVLCVTGGVPRYLEEINPKWSAEENLKRICFQKEGFLFREFDNIFSDLFSRRAGIYKSIIKSLAQSHKTLQQLVDSIGIGKGGSISEYLEDLTKIGYIKRDFTWSLKTGIESKLSYFRLNDNYLRFYLRYIEPNKNKIERSIYSQPIAWDGIMGLQFENLILRNRRKLIEYIGIPLADIVNENPYFQRATKNQKGCQVDYLIETKYNLLYPCEIKFSKKRIKKEVIEEMEKKIAHLAVGKRNLSIRPILIHVNGVEESVQSSHYFAKVIDFAQFL